MQCKKVICMNTLTVYYISIVYRHVTNRNMIILTCDWMLSYYVRGCA